MIDAVIERLDDTDVRLSDFISLNLFSEGSAPRTPCYKALRAVSGLSISQDAEVEISG